MTRLFSPSPVIDAAWLRSGGRGREGVRKGWNNIKQEFVSGGRDYPRHFVTVIAVGQETHGQKKRGRGGGGRGRRKEGGEEEE